jgi:hypothetical protein
VAHTPNWEPLADALNRVTATGVSEDEAKTNLCRAVADRKIDVRVRIAATDHGTRGRVFSDGNVGVPPHLGHSDFDWVQSRPFAQWPIGPKRGEHYAWIGGWQNHPLDLIELSTADVVEILCSGADAKISSATAGIETAASNALASHLKRNPNLKRAEAVEWCRATGYKLSDRGFQSRVWPTARAQAGLEAKAPPGRKQDRGAKPR